MLYRRSPLVRYSVITPIVAPPGCMGIAQTVTGPAMSPASSVNMGNGPPLTPSTCATTAVPWR